MKTCSFCGYELHGYGNNPEPVKPYEERCCDDCNVQIVLLARLKAMRAVRSR